MEMYGLKLPVMTARRDDEREASSTETSELGRAFILETEITVGCLDPIHSKDFLKYATPRAEAEQIHYRFQKELKVSYQRGKSTCVLQGWAASAVSASQAIFFCVRS